MYYSMRNNRVTKRDVVWFVAAVALLLSIVAWADEAQAQMMPPACAVDANDIVLCHAVWLPIVANEVIVTGDAN